MALDERELLGGFCACVCVRTRKQAKQKHAKTQKNANAPLQSLSVSMPMTCDLHDKSVEIPNVLEKAVHAGNRAWLCGLVGESLASLEDEFFTGEKNAGCTQVARLRALVREATHGELLAVFYLLLNIDHKLKTRILLMDARNDKRIARFLLDLRHELVLGFFCSEQSVAEFVQACGDGYCIA